MMKPVRTAPAPSTAPLPTTGVKSASHSPLRLPTTHKADSCLQGDKWELYIKSELAYGDNKRGNHITPGAVLIFDREPPTDIHTRPPPQGSRSLFERVGGLARFLIFIFYSCYCQLPDRGRNQNIREPAHTPSDCELGWRTAHGSL